MSYIKALVKHMRRYIRDEIDGMYITGCIRNKEHKELVIISNSSIKWIDIILSYYYNTNKINTDNKNWNLYEMNCNNEIVHLRIHTYSNKIERQELINYYKK